MDVVQTHPDRAADLTSGRLYRYRSYRLEELRNLLIGSEVRFSDPTRFNDPWECRPLFDAPPEDLAIRVAITMLAEQMDIQRSHLAGDGNPKADAEKLVASALDPQQFEAKARGLSDRFREWLSRRYRMLCLSAHNDIPLMWSQYADAHRGVCLIFDVKDPAIGMARRVNYPDAYPVFGNVHTPIDMLLVTMLNKAKYWEYEHEYRAIACGDPNEADPLVKCDSLSYVKLGATALVGIVFGCAMSESDRWQVKELLELSHHPIELYEARKGHRDYGITIERQR